MTDTDPTWRVIDAIDGALDDYTVSGDAMRWTPDPPQPATSGTDPRAELPDRNGSAFARAELRDLPPEWAEAMVELHERMQLIAQQIGAATQGMRWAPTPPEPIRMPRAELRPVREDPTVFDRANASVPIDFGPTPFTAIDTAQLYARLRPPVPALRRAAEQFGRALDHMHVHRDVAGIPVPPPLPADPRERALQARRTRNTGPAAPTAGKAHRPRRHQ